MIALEITLVLLRELLRAFAFPFRLAAYVPRRGRWKQRARELLAAPPAEPGEGDEQLRRFLSTCLSRRNPGTGGATPHLFLSVGETSGEHLGLGLMQAVNGQAQGVRWSCFGGTRLAAAGAELRYPLSDSAIMGVLGVLKALPFLWRALDAYLRLLRDDPPDLVVLVDYPGLHLVMGRLARRRGVPVLHYVAPQYWAWAPWRMQRYRHCMDATLTILPFEPRFFQDVGLPCEYVGHPLLDRPAVHEPAAAGDTPLLCLLPGSRRHEIRSNLPGMIEVAQELRRDEPAMQVVVAHTDPRRTGLIQEILDTHDADFVRFEHGALEPWLDAARLVLAKSGTGSLEACLGGTPTVIVFRLPTRFWRLLYPSCLNVPWIGAANLVAGREVAPEFCFAGDAGWARVTAAARRLWADGDDRRQCEAGLAEVRRRLGSPGASTRAARWVLPFCRTGAGAAVS